MASESFTYWNNVGTIDHSSSTGPWTVTASGQTFTPQLDDLLDGNDNGITAPGDVLSWPSLGTHLFIGFTAAGDPIISNGLPTGDTFVMSNSNLNGQMVSAADTSSNYLYCFAAGTMIATQSGETAIETLHSGDKIKTAEGHTVPVKWIGRQTQSKLFAGARMQPVRIKAGALGGGLPHSDLTVTADHGMVLEGMVINASALVNGDTIDFVPMADLDDSFTVYHVETEAHDVILANGAASETFIDAAGRRAFDNYAEYLDLYGVERIIPEMKRPRIASQRLLPDTLKQRLGITKPIPTPVTSYKS